jgi:Ca2+-binding EF-hand superfamily protein
LDKGKYIFSFKDVTEENMAKLNEIEKKMIKDKFEKIDIDKDNKIKLDETEKFYKIDSEKSLAYYSKTIEERIKKEPEKKEQHEKSLEKFKKSKDEERELKKNFFIELDIDKDNIISFEEFLKLESRFILRIKN